MTLVYNNLLALPPFIFFSRIRSTYFCFVGNFCVAFTSSHMTCSYGQANYTRNLPDTQFFVTQSCVKVLCFMKNSHNRTVTKLKSLIIYKITLIYFQEFVFLLQKSFTIPLIEEIIKFSLLIIVLEKMKTKLLT